MMDNSSLTSSPAQPQSFGCWVCRLAPVERVMPILKLLINNNGVIWPDLFYACPKTPYRKRELCPHMRNGLLPVPFTIKVLDIVTARLLYIKWLKKAQQIMGLESKKNFSFISVLMGFLFLFVFLNKTFLFLVLRMYNIRQWKSPCQKLFLRSQSMKLILRSMKKMLV